MGNKKVKICGITNIDDAKKAVKLGAWAVGFIFVPDTPRYITPEKAKNIIQALPDNVLKFGVFMDCSIIDVVNTAEYADLSTIQLHGKESVEYCKQIKENNKFSLVKVFRVKDNQNLEGISLYKGIVDFILLDSYTKGQAGGTGKTFNWKIALEAKTLGVPIILAGGLNPNNICNAYNQVKPYAFDVSSGVEKSKGIKDHDKLLSLLSKLNLHKSTV